MRGTRIERSKAKWCLSDLLNSTLLASIFIMALPVDEIVRVKSLLRMLWSKYDAGGISMGRSYESVVLEAALSLLEDVDNEEIFNSGDLLNDTRTHISELMMKRLRLEGFKI